MAKNVTSGIIKQVLGRESSSLKVVTTNVDQYNVGGGGEGGWGWGVPVLSVLNPLLLCRYNGNNNTKTWCFSLVRY